MKSNLRPARARFEFSFTLHKNLNAYALSAAAAGVAALAAVPPAAAEIVYTATHQQILPHQSFLLDLNHDGVNDFSIVNFFSTTSSVINLWASRLQAGNEVASNGSFYAVAFPAGVAIGSKGRFGTNSAVGMVNDVNVNLKCRGPWAQASDKYLGLKFEINGEIHFGWARLSVSCHAPKPAVMLLTGYAYETVAGESIKTGEIGGADQRASSVPAANPASTARLGMLALGSDGLAAWRREEAD